MSNLQFLTTPFMPFIYSENNIGDTPDEILEMEDLHSVCLNSYVTRECDMTKIEFFFI